MGPTRSTPPIASGCGRTGNTREPRGEFLAGERPTDGKPVYFQVSIRRVQGPGPGNQQESSSCRHTWRKHALGWVSLVVGSGMHTCSVAQLTTGTRRPDTERVRVADSLFFCARSSLVLRSPRGTDIAGGLEVHLFFLGWAQAMWKASVIFVDSTTWPLDRISGVCGRKC